MPGETFQTLKSKATQQAKQSGMSQSSAENYGSAMASQAAVQGNAGADFLGSNQQQVSDTVKEITNNMDFVTGSQGGPAGMTFTEAADANIMSPNEAVLAQLTQSTNENVQQQIAKRREVEKQVQEAGGVFNPQTGMVEYPQKTKLGLGSFSLENIPSLTLQAGIRGAKVLQLLLDKVFKPQASDFSNPNFLAVLDAAFKSGKLNKDEYTKKYEDLLNDVYGGQGIGSLDQATGATSLDSEGLFDLAMEEATANVEPGSGTQRITDPKGFYLDDGQGILPQTSGGLANLAGLDVNQFTSGPGYNQNMVDMIFAARAELDREKDNQFGGGGGEGIPSIIDKWQGTVPQIPEDSFKPGVDPDNPYGLPEEYMGWYGSEFDIPGAGGAMVVPITLPDGTVVNMPDTHTGNQFQQYLDSLTTTPATGIPSLTPTPFDYSQWPQYQGYPTYGPAGGPVPNYVNQGVASPQFGDWYQNLNQYYT